MGTSTKPNHPAPSVVRWATALLLASASVTIACEMGDPAVSMATPRSWPKAGCSFHGIPGTGAALAKIGGTTGSSRLGLVSASMSSARADALVRVPASVAASGVRYE